MSEIKLVEGFGEKVHMSYSDYSNNSISFIKTGMGFIQINIRKDGRLDYFNIKGDTILYQKDIMDMTKDKISIVNTHIEADIKVSKKNLIKAIKEYEYEIQN